MARDKNEDLKVVAQFHADCTEDELERVLRSFPDAGSLRRIVRPGGRPLNASALVECERGLFFVKRRLGVSRKPAMLAEEHRFVEHLRRSGVPAPEILRTQTGSTFLDAGADLYEVQARAEGDDLYQGRHTWQPFLDERHAFSVGETFRRIREASEGFPAAAVPDPGIFGGRFVLGRADDLGEAIAERAASLDPLASFLGEIPGWRDDLKVFEPFLEKVRPWLRRTPEQWIHGDPQANNCFFRDDAVVSVIDFHLGGPAPALLDLAIAVDRNTLLWLDILAGDDDAVDWRGLKGLRQGYGTLRDDEAEVLPDLVAVCHLDFAFELLRYYVQVEQNRQKASWAWEAYLVGHTRWHLSDAGKRFAVALAFG
ncbi:MAG: phosphotransferase [Fimbriimonadaceae bacterium]